MHKSIDTIRKRVYHVEILPPKQDSEKLEADLELFEQKYRRIMENGYCACITDNAMGLLAFQGSELIEELNLPVNSDQIMIHLNTFHTKDNLDNILNFCRQAGIESLLIITGDGSDRLPKLTPSNLGETDIESVTSVELLKYIHRRYPGVFSLGVAFNPYEPQQQEFAKMERKLMAGASFIVTQPLIEKNHVVDLLIETYPLIPVTIEAWMSKKLHLLSDAVGYSIPEDAQFDPIENLKQLHRVYPECGFYLSLLGFKTQFDMIQEIWNDEKVNAFPREAK